MEEIDTLEDYERVSDDIRTFEHLNQKLYHGDYLVNLAEILKKHDFKRPFLVYNSAAFKNIEFSDYMKKYTLTLYDSYSSNPRYEEIIPGLELFKRNKCDVIVAIGGGSAIDVAKAIKLFSGLNPNINYLEQQLHHIYFF